MASNEAIIHGDRHGEVYREINPTPGAQDTPEEKVYYPNGILVRSYGPLGAGVALGVVRYDQETGNRIEQIEDEDGHWGSLWADLSRDGCNRLIRALREHRDKQFGKDE